MQVRVVDGVFGALTLSLFVRPGVGLVETLLGLSIALANCIRYNPSINNMHNDSILKWTLVS